MLLLHEMKASRRSNNTSASAFYAAKGPVPAPPSGGGSSSGGGGGAPSGSAGGQPWRAPAPAHNPHATGYGKGKGKNKGYKPACSAPPMPTPFNPWTGAIQMWPMQSRPTNSGGNTDGILGRAPGPRAHAYMAAPPAAPGTHYGGYGSVPYGAALPYAAPPTPAPSWDTAALAQHFTNMTLQQPAPEWVMDSGATAHLSSDAGILSSLSPHPIYRHVVVGDGSTVPVTTSGHSSLPSLFPNTPLHLRHVLVTPSIIKNLISVRQFTTDNHCIVAFDPFGFSVKDLHSRREILRCNSTGELYTFTCPPPPRTLAMLTAPHDVWHRRLGHPGHDAYRRLSEHISLPCIRQINPSPLCHACQLGCHVRLPFSASTSRTTRPFELVHCDLWTSPVLSNSGFKYYLVIVDDFSHYIWTFPLRNKSDTTTTLINFVAYACTQFSRPLIAMQADNGTEFLNSTITTFFASHGIHLCLSWPYTSAQNRKVKRAIHTLNDVTRTLLFQSLMPPPY